MRLQSAIFTLPDALLDGGVLRPGADKVLSILKMESVWLYAVTALDRAEAQALLRSAGMTRQRRDLIECLGPDTALKHARLTRLTRAAASRAALHLHLRHMAADQFGHHSILRHRIILL